VTPSPISWWATKISNSNCSCHRVGSETPYIEDYSQTSKLIARRASLSIADWFLWAKSIILVDSLCAKSNYLRPKVKRQTICGEWQKLKCMSVSGCITGCIDAHQWLISAIVIITDCEEIPGGNWLDPRLYQSSDWVHSVIHWNEWSWTGKTSAWVQFCVLKMSFKSEIIHSWFQHSEFKFKWSVCL